MKINKIKTGGPYLLILLLSITVSLSFKHSQKIQYENNDVPKDKILHEALYVHTDRTSYLLSDTLWFKAYIVDAETLKTSYHANYLNIVLYTKDGQKIISQKNKLTSGTTNGYLTFPDTLAAGNYIFTAYSNTNGKSLNGVFSKTIRLLKSYGQGAQIRISIPDTVYDIGNRIKGNLEARNNIGARYANTEILLQLYQSDKIQNEIIVNTGNEGVGKFVIEVPKSLSEKPIFIKATIINATLNAEIYRSIPFKPSPPTIQFFPESGVAIENLENIIAFKAIDANGVPFDFMANVMDKNNRLIKKISSKYMGMGKFNLKYASSDSLYCKITKPGGYGLKYFLPLTKKNACSFNIDNKHKNRLIVKINTDKNAKDSLFKLILSFKNKTQLNKTVNINKTNPITIDTKQLPKGIVQIDLCNVEGLPIAKRVVFVNKNSNPGCKILGLKKQYAPKEQVRFLIDLKNWQKEAGPVKISLSVSRAGQEESTERGKNILSTLLLGNGLIGNTPNPGFYFAEDPLADEALDLLMLTYTDNRNVSTSNKLDDRETNIAVQGRVVKPNGKPVKHAEVMLINYKTFSITKTMTNKAGQFTFSTIDYMMVANTDSIGITATGPNNNKKVRILLDCPFQNQIADRIIKQRKKTGLLKYYQTKQYLNSGQNMLNPDIRKMKNDDPDFNKTDIKIKDVDVKAKRMSVIPKEIYEKKYISHEIKGDEIAFSVTGQARGYVFLGLLQKVVGYFEVADGGKILLRGNNSILPYNQNGAAIVVDGVFIGTDYKRLDALNPLNVEKIKVTKSSAASLRYTPFAAGLIEITMKSGSNNLSQTPVQRAMNLTQISGFQAKREYYSPLYTKNEKKTEQLDLRKTVFWEPDIQIDKSGMADIRFYTPDIPGEYLVKFEGISKKGKIFYFVKKFMVN